MNEILKNYARQRVDRYLLVREKHRFDPVRHTRKAVYFDLRQAVRDNDPCGYLERFPEYVQRDFLLFNSIVDRNRHDLQHFTLKDLPFLRDKLHRFTQLSDMDPTLRELVVDTILREKKRGVQSPNIPQSHHHSGPAICRLNAEFPQWKDHLTSSERMVVDGFTDPVLLEVPQRAVLASDGRVYEKWIIEQVLTTTGISPITREKLEKKIYPVHRLVEEFLESIYQEMTSNGIE